MSIPIKTTRQEGHLRWEISYFEQMHSYGSNEYDLVFLVQLYIGDLKIDQAGDRIPSYAGETEEETLIQTLMQRCREAIPAHIEMLEDALVKLKEVQNDSTKTG